MATSPNYGWLEPDNTDLVKNGALAIRTLGNAIDTTMATMVPKSIVDAKGDLIAGTAADTAARLAVGNNGETLVADSSTSTGLRWQGDYAAAKNKILNSDFGIWQRGTSLSGAGYLADRFQGVVTTTTITQSQQAFNAGTAPVAGYESSFFYRAVTVTGGTAGSRALVQQPIEDVRTFAGQTVTISFWAKAASGTPKIGVELAQVFGSGGSSAVTGIGATAQTISTSWARYSVTTSVPSISGKTIGTGSSLNLVLWLDAGSDFAVRASSIGNQSGTFDIWGVQVEASNVATAFQTATGTIQGELAACQRYYYRFTSASNYTYFGGGFSASTTQAKFIFKLATTMRTSPSFSATSANNLQINGSAASPSVTSVTLDQANPDSVGLFANCSSGLTAGQGVLIIGNNSSAPLFEFSSEL